MSRWQLETTDEFDKAARKLDPETLLRVRRYLEEVLELDDPRDRGRALTTNLASFWRYRIGDYRVIAEIRDDTFVLVPSGSVTALRSTARRSTARHSAGLLRAGLPSAGLPSAGLPRPGFPKAGLP